MIFNDIDESTLNVVDEETTRRIVCSVLRDMSDAVAHTLGPGGRTTLLHDPAGVTSLYPSKDGFRVTMNLHYDDYFFEAVYMIVRDVSVNMNIKVGDGTTSCLVVMKNFYDALLAAFEDPTKKEFLDKVSKSAFVTIMETAKDVLKSHLHREKVIIKLDDLKPEERRAIVRKVGTVAANNDSQIGGHVASLYDGVIDNLDELFVSIEPNESAETTDISDIGFECAMGGIHRVYATERDGITTQYKDPRILLVEGPILDGDIEFLQPFVQYVCMMLDKPLVIIADEYSNLAAEWLFKLRTGGFPYVDPQTKEKRALPALQLLPIAHSSNYDAGHVRITDMNYALGGTVQDMQSSKRTIKENNQDQMEKVLGSAKKIVSGMHNTRFFGGGGDKKKIDGRIKELQSFIDGIAMQDSERAQTQILLYKERIGMLKSNMCKIKVGGITYKEKQFKVLVYEDAVYAVKSAIKNGYTLAGQVGPKYILNKYRDGDHYGELSDEIKKTVLAREDNLIYGTNRDDILTNVIDTILSIFDQSIMTAYKAALENAIPDDNIRIKILEDLCTETTTPKTFNLFTGGYETLDSADSKLFVAGNTDWEILNSVVTVTGLFFQAKNMQTIYTPKKRKNDFETLTPGNAPPKQHFSPVRK